MHVSQKLIIRNEGGAILALRKSSTDTIRPHTWDLPGGQVEEGEALPASAKREVREETGLEISDTHFFYADARNAKNGEYWVVLFSTAKASGQVVLSDEHEAYEWISREEFAERETSDRIRDLMKSDIEF